MPGRTRSQLLGSPVTQAGLLLMGLAIVLVAGFFVVGQSRKLIRYVPVQAVVRSSRVHEQWHAGERHETHYSPQIEYEYAVAGRDYRSRTVFLDPASRTDWGWAQGWVSRYPEGGRVRAYHDPHRPQHAFLVRSPAFTPYGFVILGLLLMTSALSVERARISLGRRQIRFGAGEVCLVLAVLVVAHYAYVWLITRG